VPATHGKQMQSDFGERLVENGEGCQGGGRSRLQFVHRFRPLSSTRPLNSRCSTAAH
jgi:hypothetical protein